MLELEHGALMRMAEREGGNLFTGSLFTVLVVLHSAGSFGRGL